MQWFFISISKITMNKILWHLTNKLEASLTPDCPFIL